MEPVLAFAGSSIDDFVLNRGDRCRIQQYYCKHHHVNIDLRQLRPSMLGARLRWNLSVNAKVPEPTDDRTTFTPIRTAAPLLSAMHATGERSRNQTHNVVT
ncbi:hypothetical protein CIB48_g5567 [Xylaria polymorpha]|nr:hypothetical protein CIB48_g5567 [Xylaria polymorpha]